MEEQEHVTENPAPAQPEPDSPAGVDEISPEDAAAILDSQEAGIIAAYDGVPFRTKMFILIGCVLIIAVLLLIWHDVSFHWFEVHSGTVNESGPYYGFWSGFGSDIGEATIIVGILAAWRHHSCHVRGCARLGRQVPGTPYLACPKHHPTHKGYKRAVSKETIHTAHTQANQKPNES